MLKTLGFTLVAALCAARGAFAQDAQTLEGCATLQGKRVALDTLALEIRTDFACAPLIIELVSPSRVSLPRLRAGEGGDWVAVVLRVVNRSAETIRAPLYLYANDDLRGTVGGRAVGSWRMRAFVILHTTYTDVWNRDRGDLPPPSPWNSQRLHVLPGASVPGSRSGVDTLRLNVVADAETFDMSLVVRARRSGSVPPPPPAAKPPPRTWPPASTLTFDPYIGTQAPPTDSGQAAQDSTIRRFVSALGLPSVHSVRDIVYLGNHDLLFFSVIYGEPMDVYAGVVGVRHGKRIGLLLGASEHPWQVTDTTRRFPRFTLRRDDMVLADPAVVDTLEALEAAPPEARRFALYGYVILPLLVEDSLVPAHVLRRCVRRIYRNDVGCRGARVALAATRINDVVTLTQLSFLSGRWLGDGDAIQPARAGLRQLAPVILADARSPRATLFALAQAVSVGPTDSVLVAQLIAHPAVQRDASVLAVLAENRPWVLRKLLALLPGGPEVHAAIESLFLRWGPGPPREPDREAVVAVLADPVLGRDPAILAAIANAPPIAFPAASGEAGRRLPAGEFRRGAYLSEPPPLP